MTKTKWTDSDMPDQGGRTVLITGANSGLGLRSAQVLAAHGARVLMGCRSPERGATALGTVQAGAAGGGAAELVQLDLADLASVRTAAEQVRKLTDDRLDVLMNNAGVMATPRRSTSDGFELQFGTNHLGHAALTWLLMPALRAAPGARVVTTSSQAAIPGRIYLADPMFEHHRYLSSRAYSQAKLANLVFALELDRRLRAAGLDVLSVAAHPGYTATQLASNMARSRGTGPWAKVMGFGAALSDRLIAQGVDTGALPQIYAATAAEVRGGEYYGPDGLLETRGYPHRVKVPASARRDKVAPGLWALTAKLTGVEPDPA